MDVDLHKLYRAWLQQPVVTKDNVPKSHADLLKPVWKGQVGIVQTAYEWFAVMLQGIGQQKGMAFISALAKQQPQLRNGRTLLAQLVAAGEVNSALAAYSQNFENLKRDGAPVDWVPLDPVYGNLNPMGLSAKAPRPNAGRLFIDFVLSKGGQEVIRAQRRVPDRIDVLPDPPKIGPGIFCGVHGRRGLCELRSIREAVPRYVREQVANNCPVLFSRTSSNEFNRHD